MEMLVSKFNFITMEITFLPKKKSKIDITGAYFYGEKSGCRGLGWGDTTLFRNQLY